MSTLSIVAATATSLLILTSGCQRSDTSTRGSTAENRTPTRMSGDSIVIRTTDGAMNLGLVHDTVFMGLTDSVLTLVRNDMARDTEETKSAIAGRVEQFVKSRVSTALHTRLKYPLVDIDSATYNNGAIKFAYRDRRTMAFEDVKQDGRRALNSFSPEDAQKFVTTVNSAIQKVRGNF